ncbi:MAG: LytTR family DNA-binding domain-containing protein [Enterocloster clostridioformis]
MITAPRPAWSPATRVRGIAGYIHPVHDNLERSCLNILTCLNRRVNSRGRISNRARQQTGSPASLSSIYYIETVKGTHMCNIHRSDGVYAFRSGIKELSEKLGPPFRQVRASTIANLSNVRSFEPNPGILSFTGGISCCCSRSYRHDLSDYFRGHPGHARAERGGG